MLSTARLLRRLQRHGVPGPAPPAGVPVDRRAEAQAELAGVFAALAPVADECRREAERAGQDAAAAVESARAGAARAVADAHERAPALAQEEADLESERIEGQVEQILASAGAEAARIRVAGPARVAVLRDRVVSYVLALPDGGTR